MRRLLRPKSDEEWRKIPQGPSQNGTRAPWAITEKQIPRSPDLFCRRSRWRGAAQKRVLLRDDNVTPPKARRKADPDYLPTIRSVNEPGSGGPSAMRPGTGAGAFAGSGPYSKATLSM
jgi:hypothetical protein